MNRAVIVCGLMLFVFAGCRHEDDIQKYFYDNKAKFDDLVKASLSNSGSNARVKLEEELGVWGVNLDQSGCDTNQTYDQVRLHMDNDVYVDGMLWDCSYYYIYSVCPQDSFHYVSNNVTQGWLTPHWTYFVEKGL